MLPQQQRERRKLTRNLTFTFGFPSTAVCTWITLLANTSHISIQQSTEQSPEKKKKLYLSLKVFCTKLLLFLRLQLETGPPFYVVIRATRRSSRLHCKGIAFISQLFLSILVRPGNRTCHLPLCSQALILPCWDDFTSIFFGDYNGEHIRLIWKMIKR